MAVLAGMFKLMFFRFTADLFHLSWAWWWCSHFSLLFRKSCQTFFFFFCVPQLYLWGSPFWVRFVRMQLVFNPTIEVVTFHLHRWCMLGVFVLPAFTCLGHECQDLLSLCSGMHVRRQDLGLYSHLEEFWGNGVRTHVNSKGRIPSTAGSEED